MKLRRLLVSSALLALMAAQPGLAADQLSLRDRISVPGGQSKLTFRLRETTLREALQLVAETSGINLILDDSVQGNVSMDFFQVPLNQILETLLYSKGYRLTGYGQSFVVYKVGDPVQRLDASTPSKVFSLNFVTPKEAIDILRATFFEGPANKDAITTINRPVFDFSAAAPGTRPAMRNDAIEISRDTPRFVPMPTQNALMAFGSQEQLSLVEKVLKAIDKRRRQVLIKVQIVEMSLDDSRSLGLAYKAGARQFDGDTSRSDGTFVFDTLSNVGLNLQVKLNALVNSKRAKILASPQLLAMDSRTSVIKITDQIVAKLDTSTVQNANNTIVTKTVTPDEAGVTLEMTPRIDSLGGVTMNIHPTISVAQDPIRNTQNGDIIATLKSLREYQAQEIYVPDGQTIVIGGLIQDRKGETVTRLPFLSDLPFLGSLFQTRVETNVQTEVTIMLTPEVLKDANAKPSA